MADILIVDTFNKTYSILSFSRGKWKLAELFGESLPDEYLNMDRESKNFWFVIYDRDGDGIKEIERHDLNVAHWDKSAVRYLYR